MNAVQPISDVPVAAGTLIGGRYVVGEVLGRGGGGVVCAGHHVALDGPVAIKFLGPSEMEHDARRRFLREARLAHRLKSEHTVRIFDVGELPDGTLYLVMERLAGWTLDVELERRFVLPEREAVELAAQVAEALAEAHGLGIVHRDIKPQNLFLHASKDGSRTLKIVDFGVSRQVEGLAGTPNQTRTFMFLGTPRYMAPEQWELGAVADPRMDIYSLGVVLFEMLTASVPFEELAPQARAIAIVGGRMADARHMRPELSPRVVEVIQRCLSPRAEARPSARHLERLLRALGSSSAVSGGATLLVSNGQTQLLPREAPARPSPLPQEAPALVSPARSPRVSSQPPITDAPMLGPFASMAPEPASGVARRGSEVPPLDAQADTPADEASREVAPSRRRIDAVVGGFLVAVLLALVLSGVVALLHTGGALRF